MEYNQFEEEVKKHDLFVGVGTAAMEAAGTGIPTIFMADSERLRCLGFTHQLTEGTMGEYAADLMTLYDLEDVISGYLALSAEQRISLGLQGRQYAAAQSHENFVAELFSLANDVKTIRYSAFIYWMLKLYFNIVQTMPKLKRKFF